MILSSSKRASTRLVGEALSLALMLIETVAKSH
jgi:hypothetical protein